MRKLLKESWCDNQTIDSGQIINGRLKHSWVPGYLCDAKTLPNISFAREKYNFTVEASGFPT